MKWLPFSSFRHENPPLQGGLVLTRGRPSRLRAPIADLNLGPVEECHDHPRADKRPEKVAVEPLASHVRLAGEVTALAPAPDGGWWSSSA